MSRDGAARSFRTRDRLSLAALLAAVFLAYQPAWSGGLLWDDAAHLTRADLRSWRGLWRIWFEPGATQQYYPLLHTAFWLQHRLWGDATTGYHLVGLALRFAAAAMAASPKDRPRPPGKEARPTADVNERLRPFCLFHLPVNPSRRSARNAGAQPPER